MDWFERLTGFRETSYDDTRHKLTVANRRLQSQVNGKSYAIGTLELVSLQALRERVASAGGLTGRLKVSVVTGDVRAMHQLPENAGALFQVASQFNLLEMTSNCVTPEHGVTRYANDHTQGPACALAAGAATIYRNYFAQVGDAIGQTRYRQLNGLADLGLTLSAALGQPVDALWHMENGYAMCSSSGLDAISGYLKSLDQQAHTALGGHLRIGVHSDVEVTDGSKPNRSLVSQAFCSALPISYVSSVPREHWQAFATLILQATYEATLSAAVLNAQRSASNVVLLTQVGGGAFGNNDDWIHAAMRRALHIVSGFDLEVKLVCYGRPSSAMEALVRDFG
jgi:hypothetical protein